MKTRFYSLMESTRDIESGGEDRFCGVPVGLVTCGGCEDSD